MDTCFFQPMRHCEQRCNEHPHTRICINSSGYITRSGTARSCSSSTFNLLSDCQTALILCIHLTFISRHFLSSVQFSRSVVSDSLRSKGFWEAKGFHNSEWSNFHPVLLHTIRILIKECGRRITTLWFPRYQDLTSHIFFSSGIHPKGGCVSSQNKEGNQEKRP